MAAPARAALGHRIGAQRRRVLPGAGGADHLAHEHGVVAVLVVGVGARDLVGDIDAQLVGHGRRGGRGLGRGAGGDGGGGEEQLLRFAPRDAVDGEAVVLLEFAHGRARNLVIAARDAGLVVAQVQQALLQGPDGIAAVAVAQDPAEGEAFHGGCGFIGRGDRGFGRIRQRRLFDGEQVGDDAVRIDKAHLPAVADDHRAVVILPENGFGRGACGEGEQACEQCNDSFHGSSMGQSKGHILITIS